MTEPAAQRATRLPTGLANCTLISQEGRKGQRGAPCRPRLTAASRALLLIATFPGPPGFSASLSCSRDICSVPVPPVIPCPLQLCRPPALCGVP